MFVSQMKQTEAFTMFSTFFAHCDSVLCSNFLFWVVMLLPAGFGLKQVSVYLAGEHSPYMDQYL